MPKLFIYEWSEDVENDNITIHCFGIDENDNTVCLHISDFQPWFYIECESHPFNASNRKFLCDLIKRKIPNDPSRKLVFRQKLYEAHIDKYEQVKQFPFIRFECDSNASFNQIQRGFLRPITGKNGVKYKFKTFETNASATLQMVCKQNIQMSGWIEYPDNRKVSIEDKQTLCDNEFYVSHRSIQKTECDVVVSPKVMSFDIEVNSSNPHVMPNSKNQDDSIFQISCVISKGKSIKKYLLTLGDCGDIENVIVVQCANEMELLKEYFKLYTTENPNIITGYNITGFDIGYIVDRAQLLRVFKSACNTGMIKGKICEHVTKSWSSSAYGEQEYRYINMDGRVIIDLLLVARRKFKLANYKLETVASHFLNAHKDNFHYQDIFKAYRTGVVEPSKEGVELLTECGKYCVQDSALTTRLFESFDIWFELGEMSSVCNVPASFLYMKGEQVKVFSQVYKYCFDNNIVVESNRIIQTEHDDFQGAKVLDPKPGMYNYVVPFDFKSLYPSIIIAYNIDYSTFVNDDSIPDAICNVVEWEEHVFCIHDEENQENQLSMNYRCAHHRYRFLKSPKGVLPSILSNLLDMRQKTRKQIKEIDKYLKSNPDEPDNFIETQKTLKSILDIRQLSYKLCANSVYGVMGVKQGYLPFRPGAMSVTALGRKNLEKALAHLEKRYDAKIIYGDTDSCYVQFPEYKKEDLWERGEKIQQEILDEKIFPEAMMLEFEEKIYNPFLILSKKRYMWQTLKRDGVQDTKIGTKGVLISRRDNCPFVRDLYTKTLQDIFNQADKENVLHSIIEKLNECNSKSIETSKFVITKSVKDVKEYKIRALPNTFEKRKTRFNDLGIVLEDSVNEKMKDMKKNKDDNDVKEYMNMYIQRNLPGHIQLAQKMKQRGQRIDTGQRLEYIVTTRNGINAKQFDKLESPEYYQEYSHILSIEYLYYIKQIAKQLDELLETTYNVKKFVMTQYKLRLKKRKTLDSLRGLFRTRIVLEKDEK